ncbi:MAG: MerR family transcriptional regulator [Spirochaetes bacterium]|nr:MerR family transcriptional regulator [Spirochaetota bacterium]
MAATAMNSINYYKMSELSRISSTPIPTIRFYIKEGLLPPAIKTSKTAGYYTDDHLERLKIIKKMQTDEQKPLALIKEELDRRPYASAPDGDTVIASSEKRNAIVAAAVDLFLNNGLGETSIDDIVNKASIGKGTFYKYFKDKDDLFFQCADSIFYKMYSHVWQEIKDERDMTRHLFKRGDAFFESYPKWIDMMNQVRRASIGSNPFYKDKFKAILDQIIKPIARDIEALKVEGKIEKDLDCLGAAYMLMGMTEYAAWLAYNGDCNTEEISMTLRDLINNGIGKKQ